VAGAGNISPFHIAAWQRRRDVVVAGICDPDAGRAARRASERSIPGVFDNAQAMLDGCAADVLDIASPVETHAPLALAAMTRGLHVLCQKPLCASLDEAQALLRALPTGPRLMVHENWRFRPWYREVARWLEAGRIGTVRQARMTWFNAGLLPDAGGRLPIFERQPYMARVPRLIVGDVLIHHLDTMRRLLGPLAVRSATTARNCPEAKGEAAATIALTGAAGATAIVEGNMCAHGYPARPLDRCEILGDRGRILFEHDLLRCDGETPEQVRFDLDAGYQASFDGVIDHFVEALAARRPFETSPEDNLQTLRLVEDAYAAAGDPQ
jgi:predicted dehydrogenase